MPKIDVKIQPAIISWAVSQSDEGKIGAKLMENIRHWLDGTKNPTFSQIEALSKKTHIPLGYFFLQAPPVENIRLLEYRTVNSVEIANPSRNLIDTVYEMEAIQDWMSSYREEMNYDKVGVAGSLKGISDVNIIVDKIRNDLAIDDKWYKKCYNSSEAFKKIRGLLEKCGIIVMMSGVVAKDTHRALDVNEFRAFAIMSEWAPLIFINGADSAGGRLFSLFHEIAHLWLGENDLYNDAMYFGSDVKQIEVACNAVAAELMVPEKEFLEAWDDNGADGLFQKIRELSRFFRCSEIVIARRALDKKKIDKSLYEQTVAFTAEAYRGSGKKKISGGDYYRAARNRLDGVFVRALCESINSGRTSFTEAYRLTNTTGKTFSKIANELGGVLW